MTSNGSWLTDPRAVGTMATMQIPSHIHRITSVSIPAPRTVHVTFADGTSQTADLTPMLRGPLFGPLQDPQEFATVSIDPEFACLVWSCGADMDPGVLHDWPSTSSQMADLAAHW